ncbi:MAG: DUF6709 family protein [Oscillospiraceae bacterium]
MNKIRIAIVLIVLFIMGIMLTVSGITDIIKLNGYIPDFNYDSIYGIKKGDFVGGYVANIYDCYANETTTNTTMGIETSSRTSEEYFIMPLINEEGVSKELYITISAAKIDDRQMLYDICDATWEYLDGNTDVFFPDMAVLTRVKDLDPELKGYLIEWFKEIEIYGTSASEIEKHILPYELKIYNPNTPYYNLAGGLAIIAVFAVVGVLAYKKLRAQNEPVQAAYSAPANYNAADPGFNGSPVLQNSTAASGFTETFTPPTQPLPDIPQPVQPDEFFARPLRNPIPKSESETKIAESASAAKPESEYVTASGKELSDAEESFSVSANDMDGLDTSSLNMDNLDYLDNESEFAEDDGSFDFSNDSDYGEVDSDSITLSE